MCESDYYHKYSEDQVFDAMATAKELKLPQSLINELYYTFLPPDTRLNSLINRLIKMRNVYREHKRYDLADALRKDLEDIGIILGDSKTGTTWRRKCLESH